mgnify:FL=1
MCLLVFLLLSIFPLFSYAQEALDAEDDAEGILLAPTAMPSGTVSCFDYYAFGSVQAKLAATNASAVSGTQIMFTGTLENANAYPIVDGSLYVKVFKKRSANDGNGPDVVDQFFVKSDLSIPANSSIPISFPWTIPSYAQSGDYEIATFFTTSRKFNLLGLTFTDDVVGNRVPFTVVGEQTTGLMFDKTSVTINDAAYRFAAAPPRASATEPVTVTVTLRNTSASVQQGKVSWSVYQWDAQLRENVVKEESTLVTVPANGAAPVSITVTDAKYPVYLVVGTMTWEDTKSVIGARFVRSGIERTRINFPGVTTFPLKKGEAASIFSCLHNTGMSDKVANGRLELTLSDFEGNILHSYTYTGDVSGAMMGVADSFTPDHDYGSFVLDARLYSGDQFIDEAHLIYDCAILDPSQCITTEDTSVSGFFKQDPKSLIMLIGGGVLLLVILISGYAWYRRRTQYVVPLV